jgi:hypothetical protein
MEEKILPRPAWLSLAGGILAFFIVCVPMLGGYLAIGCAFGGLASGIQAIRIIKSDPATYKGLGLAIAGTVVSAIAALIFIAVVLGNCLGFALGLGGES